MAPLALARSAPASLAAGRCAFASGSGTARLAAAPRPVALRATRPAAPLVLNKVKKEKVTAAPKKGEKRVVEGEAAGSPEHGSQAAQPSMELWAQ